MGIRKFTFHKGWIFFLLGTLTALQTFAQPGTVRGTILDQRTKEPLVGAVIKVIGTDKGAASDVNGKFTLNNVPNGAKLQFTSVGYASIELASDFSKELRVEMAASNNSLNDVVVVGYGTQKKSDLTGAIGSVSTETMVKTARSSPVGAIQGAISGVNITRSNSKPGGGYSIDIRGVHSITGSNNPLVVIDGVQGGDLEKINPADIDKIDVLKDASATAIYGSRGANGVLIVTTKRGTTGKPKISYDGYVGIKNYTHKPDMMSGDEYVQLAREARRATNNNVYVADAQLFTDASELKSVQDHNYFDWLDAIDRTAVQTSHTLSASGGSEDAKYTLSGGYYSEQGNLFPQYYKRYNLRAALDLKANNFLSYGGSLYFTYDIRETGNGDLMECFGAFQERKFRIFGHYVMVLVVFGEIVT
jgi:TonB-linked SusC/RagA family outer membrane protein